MHFLIVGGGGHAQEVAWSLREQEREAGRSCELSFFDDALPPGPLASGLGRLVGPLAAIEALDPHADAMLVLGVAFPRVKRDLTTRLAPLGVRWATVVHPRATLGPNVRLGEGAYVAAGAVVTVNVRTGRFPTINMHAQVAHDSVLGDFVTLHPDAHVAGNVRIDDDAELGTGSAVLPGLTIGAGAVLGAACTAVRSLPGGQTYVGSPAARLHARPRPLIDAR
jgi:sugar O-acyltransferase (sialic acid O-acetyltransferase NeuD family)